MQPAAGHGSRARARPLYVVCDVSRSMWDEQRWATPPSPHQVMADLVAAVIDALAEDEVTAAVCHLGVLVFADRASTHYPLTPVGEERRLDPLPRGTWSDYVGAWRLVADTWDDDAARLAAAGAAVEDPVVLFLSDGRPGGRTVVQEPEDWLPQRARLSQGDAATRTTVVAVGLGDVDEEVLLAVRSRDPRGWALAAAPGQPAVDLLGAVAQEVVAAAGAGARGGGFPFRVPAGARDLAPEERTAGGAGGSAASGP